MTEGKRTVIGHIQGVTYSNDPSRTISFYDIARREVVSFYVPREIEGDKELLTKALTNPGFVRAEHYITREDRYSRQVEHLDIELEALGKKLAYTW